MHERFLLHIEDAEAEKMRLLPIIWTWLIVNMCNIYSFFCWSRRRILSLQRTDQNEYRRSPIAYASSSSLIIIPPFEIQVYGCVQSGKNIIKYLKHNHLENGASNNGDSFSTSTQLRGSFGRNYNLHHRTSIIGRFHFDLSTMNTRSTWTIFHQPCSGRDVRFKCTDYRLCM
jgi:hypothetical protein